MKPLGSSKAHIWILPVCWMLTAACWSLPIWKYSHSSYTFGGGLVLHLTWDLPGDTAYILGFVASLLEVAAIAAGLSFLRASLWIYAVTPIVPAYELLTFHGSSFEEYLREFGLYGAWSFYFTAAVALVAFALLYVIRRVRHNVA
jgi:hypothetical protein